MELNNITELELYFADHFDTVLFPVLAEIYQRQGQYDRAKRVCEIGLKHHPDSTEGTFILSQAEMGLGNLVAAEKLMKKVLEKYPNHETAVSALPMLQEQLGRSKTLYHQVGNVHKKLIQIINLQMIFYLLKSQRNQKRKNLYLLM